MKFQLLSAFSAMVALSACGGSNATENVDARVSLDTLKDRVVVAQNTFSFGNDNEFDEVTPAAFSQLPATGSFNYTGVAVVTTSTDLGTDFITDFAAIGASTMNVNFGSQRISGSADNFFEINNPNTALNDDSLASLQAATGERIAGSLTYEFGQPIAGANAYTGTITGAVTPRSGPQLVVNQQGIGFFTGDAGRGFIAVSEEQTGDRFKDVGVLMTRD